jgi:PAS domain S-box-containing protein
VDGKAVPESTIGSSAALRKGAFWLILLRFAGVVGGLLVVVIRAGPIAAGSPEALLDNLLESQSILCLFLASVGILNVLYLLVYRRVSSPEGFVSTQLFTDIFLLAILIYLTGGPGSVFTHFYFAVILAASLLGKGRSSLVCASVAGGLLVTIVVLFAVLRKEQLPGVGQWYVERPIDLIYFVSYLIIPVFAFYVVAVLSNLLAARLSTLRLVNDRVLRTMAEAVVICDKDHDILLFNLEAKRLFGFPENADLEGKPVEEVFKRESDKDIHLLLTTPEEAHREIALNKRTGEVRPLEAKTAVITSYHNQPIAVVCLLSDMTLRRVAEETERRNQRLEAVREMAMGIAQELRRPVASILGILVDLDKCTGEIAKARPLIDRMRTEVERQESILAEFAEFSGKGDLQFVQADLVDLVHEAIDKLRVRVIRSSIHQVQFDLPDALTCFCEPEQTRRAIFHVCQNAIEAMPDGGRLLIRGRPLARESPSTKAMVDGVLLEFYDEGKGMPPEAHEKVFEPFYGSKSGAAGLGLTIAQRVIRAHGGEIAFESRVNYGTTFTIWLPSDPRPRAALEGVLHAGAGPG